MSDRIRIAVLDDSQHCARDVVDWSPVEAFADVDVYEYPFPDEHFLVDQLKPYDVLVPMRERTDFPASVLTRLPKLKLIAMTGPRVSPPIDTAAAAAAGITVTHTGNEHSVVTTAELAWALVMAGARPPHLRRRGDARFRLARDIPLGIKLAGRTIGIVGLGRIGTRVAGYARAFGMDVIAWSPNLTAERAAAAGARLVDRRACFRAGRGEPASRSVGAHARHRRRAGDRRAHNPAPSSSTPRAGR